MPEPGNPAPGRPRQIGRTVRSATGAGHPARPSQDGSQAGRDDEGTARFIGSSIKRKRRSPALAISAARHHASTPEMDLKGRVASVAAMRRLRPEAERGTRRNGRVSGSPSRRTATLGVKRHTTRRATVRARRRNGDGLVTKRSEAIRETLEAWNGIDGERSIFGTGRARRGARE